MTVQGGRDRGKIHIATKTLALVSLQSCTANEKGNKIYNNNRAKSSISTRSQTALCSCSGVLCLRAAMNSMSSQHCRPISTQSITSTDSADSEENYVAMVSPGSRRAKPGENTLCPFCFNDWLVCAPRVLRVLLLPASISRTQRLPPQP